MLNLSELALGPQRSCRAASWKVWRHFKRTSQNVTVTRRLSKSFMFQRWPWMLYILTHTAIQRRRPRVAIHCSLGQNGMSSVFCECGRVRSGAFTSSATKDPRKPRKYLDGRSWEEGGSASNLVDYTKIS